jgi:hypothetical protein
MPDPAGLTLTLLLTLGATAASQDAAPQAPPAARDPERFRRKPASGRYLDPESRFSLQGYVTGTFADFQEDFPGEDLPPPGQLLVPRTDRSSFQYDWALFLGSRLSDEVSFVVETHFVTRGDGNFRPDIVTTEARVTWMPFEARNALRLSLGQYWAPFGSVNDDWFSAVNLFGTFPLASRAFPLHYNERGVMAEGEFDLGGSRGLNYVLSFGNGVSGMSIEEQHGNDLDGNKSLVGRLGFFPAGPSFEIGLSGMTGDFRDAPNPTLPATDPLAFPAAFRAVGADARYSRPSLELRGYGIWSTEELDGAADLGRWGFMAEGAFRVARRVRVLREVWLKGRFDRSQLDTLRGPKTTDNVWSLGLNVRPAPRATLKVEGFFHDERHRPARRDNGLVVQMSASF